MQDQKGNRSEDSLSTLDLRGNLNSVFLHLPPVEVRDWLMSSFFLFQGTRTALRSPGAVGGNRAKVRVLSPSCGLKWKGCGFQMGYKATKTELTEPWNSRSERDFEII